MGPTRNGGGERRAARACEMGAKKSRPKKKRGDTQTRTKDQRSSGGSQMSAVSTKTTARNRQRVDSRAWQAGIRCCLARKPAFRVPCVPQLPFPPSRSPP